MTRATQQRAATPNEFKAMAHPLRLRILRLCLHEAMTNKDLADRLGKDPATVLHHVRLLERTGFLAAQPARHGTKGALEKPYLATRKSWVLSASSPDEAMVERVAVLDALRAELVEAGPEGVLDGARLGVRLSAAKAKRYQARIDRLIKDLAVEADDPHGERFGFYVVLHRRERA